MNAIAAGFKKLTYLYIKMLASAVNNVIVITVGGTSIVSMLER